MDFFCKGDQIHRKLQIWSHLLKKSIMKNFFFCAVILATINSYEKHPQVFKEQKIGHVI